MQNTGWIPREQILGAEAAARVPSEFLPQKIDHANPPTLLLWLQLKLDKIEESVDADVHKMIAGTRTSSSDHRQKLEQLRALWYRLDTWYNWFVRTQAGALPFTYRWRGRDASDGRLNALTLASGLDDFPRALVPTDSERHVDLLSWLAFFSRFMARLAVRLGDRESASRYGHSLPRPRGRRNRLETRTRSTAFCVGHLFGDSGGLVQSIQASTWDLQLPEQLPVRYAHRSPIPILNITSHSIA